MESYVLEDFLPVDQEAGGSSPPSCTPTFGKRAVRQIVGGWNFIGRPAKFPPGSGPLLEVECLGWCVSGPQKCLCVN